MTRLVFWDVDTLYDFMRTDGKRYVTGSEEILPAVQALTDYAHEHNIPIVASEDSHELSDSGISGTPGRRKIAETALRNPLVIEPELHDPGALAHEVLAHRGDFLLHKHTVDVFSNANILTLLRTLEPETVVIYGVATDSGVKYTLDGLLQHRPGAGYMLVTDAIRAIAPNEAERLVASWRERGVRMITSRDVLETGVLAPLTATL